MGVSILKPAVEKRKREQAKNIHFNRAVQGKNSIKSHKHPKEPLNSSARRGKLHHSLQSTACLLLTPRGLGFRVSSYSFEPLCCWLVCFPRHLATPGSKEMPQSPVLGVTTHTLTTQFDKTSHGKVSGGQHKAENRTQGCNTAYPNHGYSPQISQNKSIVVERQVWALCCTCSSIPELLLCQLK